ncbi:MBD2 protein, partial [Columbina picui]|nr:MBD2 protein [Columbina picui]
QGKPDLNTTLPIRQTASIFKQPVTKVTNHPSNKVRSDPQRVTEQPRQLFWEKRLQGLSASDVSEQIIKSMELPKGLQAGLCSRNIDISFLIQSLLGKQPRWHLRYWDFVQCDSRADVCAPFSLRKQEERVQQVRKKLEEALMADILSRAADSTKDVEVEMDNGDEA